MKAMAPTGSTPISRIVPRGETSRHDAGYRALGAGLRDKHVALVDTDAVLTGIMARACAEFGGRTSVWPNCGKIDALPDGCHGLIAGGAARDLARISSLADVADACRSGAFAQIVVVLRLTDGRIGGGKTRWMARPIHEDYVLAALSAAMAEEPVG